MSHESIHSDLYILPSDYQSVPSHIRNPYDPTTFFGKENRQYMRCTIQSQPVMQNQPDKSSLSEFKDIFAAKVLMLFVLCIRKCILCLPSVSCNLRAWICKSEGTDYKSKGADL